MPIFSISGLSDHSKRSDMNRPILHILGVSQRRETRNSLVIVSVWDQGTVTKISYPRVYPREMDVQIVA